jgi:arsenate reductase-like glutaredoxin family protein
MPRACYPTIWCIAQKTPGARTAAAGRSAKDLGIPGWTRDGERDRERWIGALVDLPELIQRPIVTADDGYTVVGRSGDALREVLGHRKAGKGGGGGRGREGG